MEFNLPQIEKKVLNFWRKNQIFEKSVEQRRKAPDFVFYEGPPTANARPGIHHVLSRVFKDIVCRFKTMRGFRVLRKAGWDTHGLPVELEIEKKLGFETKKDIENFGISKFNKECKKSVWRYKKEWEKLTERIGFWLDLNNPYITYEPEYIETVWFILKKIWEKKLLYQDFRVSPYCPRCQTVLSSHELAQGYKKVKESAIYVKFRILNPEFKNTSFLVWTTTPWTLPGNVAIAVNPKFTYAKVKIGGESFILAKERIKTLFLEHKIEKEFLGEELVGLRYQPLFDFYIPNFEKEKIWEILPAEFVSLEEGTGLVHIAPAFGEEDMELIKIQNSKIKDQNEKKFPIIINIDEEGKFKLDVKKWAKLFVKDADPLIIQDLKERGLLFKEELYEHDYPFCWRCKTPLLYYAKKSWFIKISDLKEKLIENNQKINWIPSHIKEGRFGEWLKEVKDWALSRERYWGTPLPVWQCGNCGHQEIIGSREELKKQKFSTNRYFLLRHGESVANINEFYCSFPEPKFAPLTKKGIGQIKKIISKLKKKKIDLIFSSPVLRCRQSAEIVAKELGLKVKYQKELREIDVGVFNGKSFSEAENYFHSQGQFGKREILIKKYLEGFPGGESYFQVRKRMINFIKKIETKYKNKNILIVSHKLPLLMLESLAFGWTKEEYLTIRKNWDFKLGELREWEYKQFPLGPEGDIDFHRPYIDEVKFYCPKCSKTMQRVSEVIDCWFDSGSMPFAQYHWRDSKPPKLFPADYIAEGVDQTRGWFYTLLAISTLLDFGPSFKNVISLGHVLDEKGEKMSKSKGNVVDPWLMIEKYGADTLRWYFFVTNQPGDSKLFSEKEIEETLKRFILTFWNCFLFFKTYTEKVKISKIPVKKITLLDKWILSKLNNLILKVEDLLNNFQITQAARLIEKFVIEDLSLWYIRRSRRRFQKPKTKKENKIASQVLGFVLLNTSKILSPFLPFLTDYVWHELLNLKFNVAKSVHLENWPKIEKRLIDKKLEKKMEKAREIVAKALSERAKAKIKIRQPLRALQINNFELSKENELLELIKEEVNVKEITFGKEFILDTNLTPELKEEGVIRELIRHIQEIRKKMKLRPKDKILVKYKTEENLAQILEKNRNLILEEGKIKILEKMEEKERIEHQEIIKIDNISITLGIKKI